MGFRAPHSEEGRRVIKSHKGKLIEGGSEFNAQSVRFIILLANLDVLDLVFEIHIF